MQESLQNRSSKKWTLLLFIAFFVFIGSSVFLFLQQVEEASATLIFIEKSGACGNDTCKGGWDEDPCGTGSNTCKSGFDCTANSCKTGSNTCKGGWDEDPCGTGSNTCKGGWDEDPCGTGSNTCKGGWDEDPCGTGSNTCKGGWDEDPCGTGSNTCKGGWDSTWNSCKSGSNTCKGGYDRTWNSCKTGRNTCRSSSCCGGRDPVFGCQARSCCTGSNTCKGGWDRKYNSCKTGSNTCRPTRKYNSCKTGSNTCRPTRKYNSCKTGSNTCRPTRKYNSCKTGSNTCRPTRKYNSCKTGSNTCKGGFDCTANSCKTGSNTCKPTRQWNTCKTGSPDTMNCPEPDHTHGTWSCSGGTAVCSGGSHCEGTKPSCTTSKGTWSCSCSAPINQCGSSTRGTWSCTCSGGNCGAGDKSGNACTQNPTGCPSGKECSGTTCVDKPNCPDSKAGTPCTGTGPANNCGTRYTTGIRECNSTCTIAKPPDVNIGGSCTVNGKAGTLSCSGCKVQQTLPPYTCNCSCGTKLAPECGTYSDIQACTQSCSNPDGCRTTVCSDAGKSCTIDSGGVCKGGKTCSNNACVCPAGKIEVAGVCTTKPECGEPTYSSPVCDGNDYVTRIATCPPLKAGCPSCAVGTEINREANSDECTSPGCTKETTSSPSICNGNILETKTTITCTGTCSSQECTPGTTTEDPATCACGCSGGACIKKVNGKCPGTTNICVSTSRTTTSCQDLNTVLYTTTTTCGPQGCTGGTCKAGTKTSTTSCPQGQTCIRGKCTRGTQTCNPAVGTTCKPQNNCGDINTGTIQSDCSCSVSAPADRTSCTTTPPPITTTCSWQNIGEPTHSCNGNTRVSKQQQECVPAGCTGGTCTAGQTREKTSNLQCTQGACCKAGVCSATNCGSPPSPSCTKTSTTQTICHDTTTTKLQTQYNCNGTTEWRDTSTTDCCQGKTCSNGVCVGTCDTGITCTWQSTSNLRITKSCSNTTTRQTHTQREHTCGPASCTGGSCTKGSTKWINEGDPVKQSCPSNQFCENGTCTTTPPVCTWVEVTS